MTQEPRTTEHLSRFVSQARWDDIPAEVRHDARRALVNYFAAALGGCKDAAVDIACTALRPFQPGDAATLIGRGMRADILHGARLNAMSANALDFDDTHFPTIIHPSAPVAAALFALAEARPVSGRDLLLAFVLGVETACRLGRAVSPVHYERGWHITATCGVFGAAAATCKALGLDGTSTLWALGHASATASGLVHNIGTMSKNIGIGNAASNGLMSGLLAAGGFSGPDEPLDGRHGYLQVSSAHPPASDAIAGALGATWELSANTYKPYPCGIVLNPVVEACLALAREGGLAAGQVEQVTVTGHPLLLQRADRPFVTTGREAQVSAQHAVAAALARGAAGIDEFSDAAVRDPVLVEIASKVRMEEDAGYDIGSVTVRVSTRDGSERSRHIEHAYGGLERPLSDADLERKFFTLHRHGGSTCRPEPLLSALWDLDNRDDAGAIVRMASGSD